MPTELSRRRSLSIWAQRRREPGWQLLPLRAFLGLTFVYAGLQKLANPDYLDPRAPASVAHQMQSLQHTSPIGALLTLSLHAPTLVGLLIAGGELAVGIGTVLGLLSRVAAIGGALLALSFFLTASWSTTPYYYGADIVFFFAWTVLIAAGSSDVYSLDGWIRHRARRDVGLRSEPTMVRIAAPVLKSLCARGTKCGLGEDGACTRLAGCPVFVGPEKIPTRTAEALSRRRVLTSSVLAGAAGAITLLTAGLTALIGRAVGGTPRRHAAMTTRFGAGASTPSSSPTAQASSGTVVAAAAAIAVGDAKSFINPADGNPAYIVHTSGPTFVAFSAVCTHAGCPVQYDKPNAAFICPCHGGVYDANTGAVRQGPPPAPLPSIPVRIINGQITVD